MWGYLNYLSKLPNINKMEEKDMFKHEVHASSFPKKKDKYQSSQNPTEDDMWRFDPMLDEKPKKKPTGKLSIKAPPKKPKPLTVKDLKVGQIFRFAGSFTPGNIYMVIDPTEVSMYGAERDSVLYVFLKNGRVYSSYKSDEKKAVVLVDATLTIEE